MMTKSLTASQLLEATDMTKNKNSKKKQSFASKSNFGAKASHAQSLSSKSPGKQKAVNEVTRSSIPRPAPPVSNTSKASSGLSELQLKFKKKLEGARFRTINESLYTCRGDEAFAEFQTDPSLFDVVILLYIARACLFLFYFEFLSPCMPSIMKVIGNRQSCGPSGLWITSFGGLNHLTNEQL